MRYNAVAFDDIANGRGVGVSLYLQGCSHFCPGCFNPETWDFDGGEEFNTEVEKEILNHLGKPHINHLSILGGEPLAPCNLYKLSCFINKVNTIYPHITIWLWTGYTWENLILRTKNGMSGVGYLKYILKNVDYLIDGPYIQEQKDLALSWRGSRNQRIIKSAESMRVNSLIIEE